MTFERFMAACLYDATHGYYGQIHREIGLRGDFFTSVSVGSVFGELLADWVAATWNALDRPASFTLLEQGAHDGQLLEDILVALRARHTDLLSALRLLIIEPLPARQAQQRERLQAAGVPCIWSATLEEAPEQPAGAFLANELLDAFPVQRWRWVDGAWREIAVAVDEGGRFCERLLAPAPPPFPLPSPRSEGYTTELCPALRPWAQALSRVLSRGRALLLDYGREADDYFAPHRTDGTLRGYRLHQRCDDPFAAPGETDLTADVNFTHVRDTAEAAGWRVVGSAAQERFLVRLATPRLLASPPPDAKWVRQFQTLTHPAQLGRQFQVMVLEK